MALDKELYRQAYRQYSQWNEGVMQERLGQAGQLSPVEAWQCYADLVEFCWSLGPDQSQWQREEKLAALNRYYDGVRQLETWRNRFGKTT